MERQSLIVALPGEMYERAGRWWWRVQLPGEDRPRARALKAPGAKAASRDRDEARELAVQMWGQAVTDEACRRITLEYAQKVERLKAQFLHKVQSLTEIVRGANARAEAETKARAEIEAKLNAAIRAAGPSTASPPARECETARTSTNDHGRTRTEAAAEVGESPRSSPSAVENHDQPPQTGVCECCGAADIPAADLACIDSGQLLCPDCFHALHRDISRIESYDVADSRA